MEQLGMEGPVLLHPPPRLCLQSHTTAQSWQLPNCSGFRLSWAPLCESVNGDVMHTEDAPSPYSPGALMRAVKRHFPFVDGTCPSAIPRSEYKHTATFRKPVAYWVRPVIRRSTVQIPYSEEWCHCPWTPSWSRDWVTLLSRKTQCNKSVRRDPQSNCQLRRLCRHGWLWKVLLMFTHYFFCNTAQSEQWQQSRSCFSEVQHELVQTDKIKYSSTCSEKNP